MAVPKIFVRSAFNYDVERASDETALRCDDPSLAVQSGKDEADINVIVKKFLKTGELPQMAAGLMSVDVDDVFDFQSAMNYVRQAEMSFAALPAEIRARFQNDAGQFVAFYDNPDNVPELVRLGLMAAPVPGDPVVPATGVEG